MIKFLMFTAGKKKHLCILHKHDFVMSWTTLIPCQRQLSACRPCMLGHKVPSAYNRKAQINQSTVKHKSINQSINQLINASTYHWARV